MERCGDTGRRRRCCARMAWPSAGVRILRGIGLVVVHLSCCGCGVVRAVSRAGRPALRPSTFLLDKAMVLSA
ncbi:hypothetical protein BJX99DRAFT_241977 [Aspergillus californicus]